MVWWIIGIGFVVAFVLFQALTRRRGPRRSPYAVLSDPEAGIAAKRIWRNMQKEAQPTLLLAPTDNETFSKLGGDPETPTDATWPSGPQGPLGFLLQLDLAEVRAAGGPEWLDGAGSLYAFHDERWGLADQIRVIHAAPGPRQPLAPPEALAPGWRYPERRAEFLTYASLPSLDWLEEDVRELDLDDEELDALADAPNEAFGDELQHRVGGYPSELQDGQLAIVAEYVSRGLEPDAAQSVPPAIRRAAKAWRLLFQIDSDPALKMSWGDSGRFYVFIREADARKGDFSKTVTLSQSH